MAEAGEEFRSAREHSTGPQEPEFKLPKSPSPVTPIVGFFRACQRAVQLPKASFVLQSTVANMLKPQRHSGAAFYTVVAAEAEQEEGLSSPPVTGASHSTSHQLPGTCGLDMLTAQAMPWRHFSK